MTGPDLRAIRHKLGLSTVGMGRALGYGGSDNSASVTIRRYESNGRPIPAHIVLRLIEQGWYRPKAKRTA